MSLLETQALSRSFGGLQAVQEVDFQMTEGEIRAVIAANGLEEKIHLACLPAQLHNRPERIPEAVRARIGEARGRYARIKVAYADCGTGGQLDKVLDRYGVSRLPGAHCYEFYSGSDVFEALADEEPGTFYLTDFLARHFQRLVIEGLKLDKYPELKDTIFGNYERVLYLSQGTDGEIEGYARAAAEFLGLPLERMHTGYGELETDMQKHLIAVG